MPTLQISETQVENWILAGVQGSIQSMLRDGYGAGADLKKAMAQAVKDAEPQLVAAMKIAIATASSSPAFQQAVQREVIDAMGKQFKGTFDGVIKAAAKQTANAEVIRQIVAQTQEAITKGIMT